MTENSIEAGIIMGSEHDEVKMIKAREVFEAFGVRFASGIWSAHRTPKEVPRVIQFWTARGCKVFIAGAGWAAHLAGAIAGMTVLPVIGVPISSSRLNGLDALLATVQMPKGIPVATVAIDCADNAAYLAIQILATRDERLRQKLEEHRQQMEKEIKEKNEMHFGKGWPR
jgi:phosphoribosylaminoimidazole carboxylase PurE protein